MAHRHGEPPPSGRLVLDGKAPRSNRPARQRVKAEIEAEAETLDAEISWSRRALSNSKARRRFSANVVSTATEDEARRPSIASTPHRA